MVQSTNVQSLCDTPMTYTIDIISCITERFMALTVTEKRIAQFILDDVATAVELPIAELARLTDTSQASVTRFARTLGCKDVRELKVKLAQSLAIGKRFILDVPDLDGIQGIYESIISVLDTHRRSLDTNAINQAVSWLSQARQIWHWEPVADPPFVRKKFSIACFVLACRW